MASPSTPAAEIAEEAERYELTSRLDACDIQHDGALIDFGSHGTESRRHFAVGPFTDVAPIDREGASFQQVFSKALNVEVWLDQPLNKPSLSLRAHGGTARLVHVSVDEQRLGALRLPNGETRVLATGAASTPLPRGRHRVTLRFSPAPRGSKLPLVELDWLRLGELQAEPAKYAAPTYEDIVSDVALDRIPKHSLVLRAPSSVRCFLRPSADSRLKVAVGLWGSGKGSAEIKLLRDAEPPVLLQSRKVTGGDGATWTPVTVDLGPYAGSIVGLELYANEATRGGRIAFGDPVLVRQTERPPVSARARVAVVVVLSALERRRVPPWGPTGSLATLADLARNATVFGSHRVPSSVPAAVLASLLSGLSPRAHGLEDPNSKLAPEIHLLSEAVKEANGRTAMFTGAPTSFATFGFDQGWDVFDPISPVKDYPASEPLQRATRWLEQALDDGLSGPVLVVVHARGAHPPWDVTREESQHLKPQDYAGIVDPRRGGILIGALRSKPTQRNKVRRMSDDDWARLRALSDVALAKQDAAIGQMVGMLKRKSAWDDTAFVVTSDVAPGDPPDFPFDPRGPLTEDRLLVPLYVHFPGNNVGGQEARAASAMMDLNVTLLHLLGLRVPSSLPSVDLLARALGREPIVVRSELATLNDKYSARLGSWLLRGQIGSVPTLCALDVDPACATDTFDRELIAARALWQATFRELTDARKLTPKDEVRRVTTIDEDTAAALTVWGDHQ
ncbi:MAG TPA: sulfatase-like hydrolase/transferase [Polyangiaceae bacterium]|nr:sulfatase-like hydrolase/transferase [Polyangiaceae bacterium]